MEITINQVERILKTLPIGYYARNDHLEVTLDNSEMTYCDLMNDKINIGFKMIQNSMSKVKKESNEQLEGDIRCALYHEVGHAYITPKSWIKVIKGRYPTSSENKIKAIVNIFEDERMEELLRKFFMGVNFREFVKRVNDYDPKDSTPKNAMSKFYELVRYRKGPRKYLNRVHDIIIKNRKLKDSYWEVRDYIIDILNLYSDYTKESPLKVDDSEEEVSFEKKRSTAETDKDKSLGSSKSKDSSDEEGTEEEGKETPSSCDENSDEDGKTSDSCSGKEDAEGSEDFEIKSLDEFLSKDEIESEETLDKESLSKKDLESLNPYYNKDFEEKLKIVLSGYRDYKKKTGSAINSYSGVFDPRAVVREDYKYFVQKNRAGHVKAFSKFHLNLFIDTSGSFYRNEDIVNSLLYSLVRYERTNPDFTFDLVTMSMGEELRGKHERFIHCDGGNRLDKEVFNLMKTLQKSDSSNYTIVLFDGDALTDGGDERNFGAFNRRDAVVISDPSNERYINKYCTDCRKILTYEYTDELIDNVIDSFKIMVK